MENVIILEQMNLVPYDVAVLHERSQSDIIRMRVNKMVDWHRHLQGRGIVPGKKSKIIRVKPNIRI